MSVINIRRADVQVYDSCVQNQVFYFAVTNLKQWVFGSFVCSYTTDYLGPGWIGSLIVGLDLHEMCRRTRH
jgi:hypothetical protein